MTMEIKGSGSRPPVESAEANKSTATQDMEPARNGAARSATLSSSTDTFSLTNKATQLQQLEAEIAQLPVVDTQRVLDVQHALATGTLQVEPARVADKLLQFESALAVQTAEA